MDYTKHTITQADGWVQVALEADPDVTLQNQSAAQALAYAGTDAPAADAPGLDLGKGDVATRALLGDGDVYLRAAGPITVTALVAK